MKKKKEAAPKLDKKQRPTQGGQALKFLGSTVIKLTRSKDEDKVVFKVNQLNTIDINLFNIDEDKLRQIVEKLGEIR